MIRNTEKNRAGIVQLTSCIVGLTRAAGATDFTAATTVQTYVISALKPGDIVMPGSWLDVTTVFAHASTVTAQVGITGTIDLFLAATSVKSTTAKTLVSTVAAAALPYVNNTASDVSLILTLTTGATTVSAITAGECWVWVPVLRKAGRWTGIDA